jgi:hypothetical protein
MEGSPVFTIETGFDRAAIAKDFRRRFRIWAPVLGHRAARKAALAEAWEFAEGCKAIVLADAEMAAEEIAERDEAIAIQCSTDGALSAGKVSRLAALAEGKAA